MGNYEAIRKPLDNHIRLHEEATTVLDKMFEIMFSEKEEGVKELYETYVDLGAKIQKGSFELISLLKRSMLGDVDANKGREGSQIHLYWSARPGRYLDPESGKSYDDLYGAVSSVFTGTIAEWNHSLTERIKDVLLKISNSEAGTVFVSPKIYKALRISPLYIQVNDGNLVGRIGEVDLYLEEDFKRDEVVVVSSEKTSGIITVKDLI